MDRIILVPVFRIRFEQPDPGQVSQMFHTLISIFYDFWQKMEICVVVLACLMFICIQQYFRILSPKGVEYSIFNTNSLFRGVKISEPRLIFVV